MGKAPAVSTRILGETMRDAVRNKEKCGTPGPRFLGVPSEGKALRVFTEQLSQSYDMWYGRRWHRACRGEQFADSAAARPPRLVLCQRPLVKTPEDTRGGCSDHAWSLIPF